MACRITPRSGGDSSPLVGATPTTKHSGCSTRNAAARSATIGIPLRTPSSTSPASRPAFVLSMTDVISYRSDWRTSPFAVLPSISAKLPSQKTVALGRVGPLVDEDIEAPGVEAQRRRRDRPDQSRSTVIEASPISIGVTGHPTGPRARPAYGDSGSRRSPSPPNALVRPSRSSTVTVSAECPLRLSGDGTFSAKWMHTPAS